MDRETFFALSDATNRVCTNMMIALETMWEIESQGIIDQKVLDRLSFAMNVIVVLQSQLDDEFERVRPVEDD